MTEAKEVSIEKMIISGKMTVNKELKKLKSAQASRDLNDKEIHNLGKLVEMLQKLNKEELALAKMYGDLDQAELEIAAQGILDKMKLK